MRAAFMNLLLLVIFQVILALMISELESDQILTENYEKLLVGNHQFHEARNAEEELWRTSEIILKNNLPREKNFQAWIEETPGKKTLTGGWCEIGKINATRLEEIVVNNTNPNNKGKYTIIGDASDAQCEGKKVGSTGIKISSGGAARVIWSEQVRYWHS